MRKFFAFVIFSIVFVTLAGVPTRPAMAASSLDPHDHHHYHEHVRPGENEECDPMCENGKHGCPVCASIPHDSREQKIYGTKIVFALPKQLAETLAQEPDREFRVSAGPETDPEPYTTTLNGTQMAETGGRVLFRYTLEQPFPLALYQRMIQATPSRFELCDAKTGEQLFVREGFHHTGMEYNEGKHLVTVLFELL